MSDSGLFLRPGDGSEEPYPVRSGCKVTPLIESAEMYPLLEREILRARERVWIAFRVFDPATRLRSKEARAAGHETWADLVAATVERGVEVRILLSDFEPVMADYLHAGSWSSFSTLQRRLSEAPDNGSRFQMIVIQHEGEIGWGWRQLLRLLLRFRLRRLITRLLGRDGKDDDVFAVRPGLWRWLKWKGKRPLGWRPGPPPRLWPATYHQKCVVIDRDKTIIGGLDLDERRWDDSGHDRPADETWHDVSSLVEGALATDAACHFAQLWNRELPRFRSIVDEWTDGAARKLVLGPLGAIEFDEEPVSAEPGGARVQLARTLSRKSSSVFATGPLPDVRELKAAHRKLIAGAKRQLYIEAQFFRSRVAADWLIAALRENPALEVIILVANVPEEIAFLGQGDNPAHRHGEWLQARSLGRILKAGGPERVGLFTMVKHEATNGKEKRYEESRGTAFGSGVIHIHAKLMIADDSACLLSSANINGRSFEWDTELGYLWAEEGEGIARFRRDLWHQLFDGALPDDAGLADWHHLAETNRTSDPEDRKGFVLPYQRSRARRFGNPYWWIPDSLV